MSDGETHERFALALTVLVAVSCNESPPGGPGATDQSRNTGITLRDPDNTFRLDVPNLETNINQGETKTIKISIKRNRNFDQDVRLDFMGAPQGVKVTPADRKIKASVNDVTVTIEASPDAALGKHDITVTGTPTLSGAATSAKFKIDVKEAR